MLLLPMLLFLLPMLLFLPLPLLPMQTSGAIGMLQVLIYSHACCSWQVLGLNGSMDTSPVPLKKAQKRKSRTPTSSC